MSVCVCEREKGVCVCSVQVHTIHPTNILMLGGPCTCGVCVCVCVCV